DRVVTRAAGDVLDVADIAEAGGRTRQQVDFNAHARVRITQRIGAGAEVHIDVFDGNELSVAVAAINLHDRRAVIGHDHRIGVRAVVSEYTESVVAGPAVNVIAAVAVTVNDRVVAAFTEDVIVIAGAAVDGVVTIAAEN